MRIDEFEWDDANIAKVGLRRYVPERIDTALDGPYVLLRNRRGHSGTHRLVGRMLGREFVTIVIVATAIAGRWRVVTAWPSDAEEQTHARRLGI